MSHKCSVSQLAVSLGGDVEVVVYQVRVDCRVSMD